MIFKKIIFDYISNNKSLIYGYIALSSIIEVVKVIVLSIHYGKLMDTTKVFSDSIHNVMAIWVILCLLFIGKTKLESTLYSDILFYIRNTLFKQYIRHNYFEFDDFEVTSDVTRIFEVARTMRDAVYYVSQTIIPMVILTVCINIYFLTLYTKVGIVNVIANIFNIIIINSYMDDVIEFSNIRQAKMINVLNKLQENFGNMMDIFLNGMDEDAIENYMLVEKDHAVSHKNEFANIGNFINTLKTSNYIFSLISIYLLYTSSTKESFVEGLLIFSFYLPVIQNLADDIPKFVTILGNLKGLEKILEPKLEYEERKDRGLHIYNSQGSIQFKNITFSYMKDKYNKTILSNFNLNILAGERIAIVSESGTGKTTIMKLLLKFYKPTQGTILFNNINIDDLNTKDIRKEVNYINQKTLLFNDTILNNMKYGNSKSDNDILKLLLDYDLLKIFNPKPNNMMECLHRMVEANGVNMSLGMQKIIFLIRGVMKENCSVYIFDEPLTSIDPDTRKKVLKLINDNVKGKTLIIITHDKEVGAIVNKTIKLTDLMK